MVKKEIFGEPGANFQQFSSDKDYYYLLMEPCLGGELMTLLESKKRFSENHSRFYSACAIKAIQFLHQRKIGNLIN